MLSHAYGKNQMEIKFVSHAMPKVTAMGTVSFQAIVNDQYLWCEISREVTLPLFSVSLSRSH
jgi:hypothetical protein